MILRYLFRDLRRRLPSWDPASKLSLGIAIVLLLLLFWLGIEGPQSLRIPARFGAFGLLLTVQLIFFWGNRRAISPYHQAQRHFVAGDYGSARKILEQIPDSGRASVDALVLLGNTYRHLGEFELGRKTLQRALQLKPDYHYAWYAAGKLSLVAGRFGEAADELERALATGAPALVHFDAGLARFMHGEQARAIEHFSRYCAGATDEPEKVALVRICQFIADQSDLPHASEIGDHLSLWQDEAAKYAGTPYGENLGELVEQMPLQVQTA